MITCALFTALALPLPPTTIDTSRSFATLSVKGQATFAATRTTPVVSLYSDCSIRVGYEVLEIQIARELTSNQCLTNHVMTHEQKHIDLYKERLNLMVQRLPELTKEHGLEKAFEIVWTEVKKEQRALDTYDEYQSNMTACYGDIRTKVNFANLKGDFE